MKPREAHTDELIQKNRSKINFIHIYKQINFIVRPRSFLIVHYRRMKLIYATLINYDETLAPCVYVRLVFLPEDYFCQWVKCKQDLFLWIHINK